MKYILMMTGTKSDFDWYAQWSKEDLQAQFAFMHAFNKELKDSGTLVAAEGLAFPDQAKDSASIAFRSQPDAWRYVREVQDAGKPADATGYR